MLGMGRIQECGNLGSAAGMSNSLLTVNDGSTVRMNRGEELPGGGNRQLDASIPLAVERQPDVMLEPRPSAGRLLQAAARAQTAVAGERSPAVTQRLLSRLREHLGKLIGPAGFDTLLARALVLAGRSHPTLTGITSGPGVKLEVSSGLDLEGTDFDEDALAIVAHLIELLVSLVGEDVAVRMLRDLWPVAPGDEAR
jgi:hypothetical protein